MYSQVHKSCNSSNPNVFFNDVDEVYQFHNNQDFLNFTEATKTLENYAGTVGDISSEKISEALLKK